MSAPISFVPDTAESRSIVYVVDDNPDIQESVRMLLSSVNLEVRTFASGEAFVSSIDRNARGCVLLDMRMSGMSGLKVQETLKERGIHLPIIFLTGYGEIGTAVQAMRDGALDYIEKPFQPQELLDRVHSCLKLDQEICEKNDRHQSAINRLACLTPRELEIAKWIVAGKPSKIISSKTNISEKTVDVHRHNILKKTNVKSAAELVQLWMDAKFRIS